MHANTCWGLLSLAVGFGLAILGLPPNYAWLQPYLVYAAGLCGVASIICFIWPLIKALRPLDQTLTADINAAEGFKEVIARSKWSGQHTRNWKLLRPVMYEADRPELDIIKDRLHQELDSQLHDYLRQGRLAAWGRPSLPGITIGPEEQIEPAKWREIVLHFDGRSLNGIPPNICAFRRDGGPRGGGLAYVQTRFSRAQLFKLFPLKRKIFSLQTVAPNQTRAPQLFVEEKEVDAKTFKSELDWNFEQYGPFIGMSAGPEQQIRIHNFQARGWNGTVRSDRTNRTFPIKINDGRGNMISTDKIDVIPVGTWMDVSAPFSPDGDTITISKFLNEIVPFTFFFEYNGKQFRKSFTLEQFEPRIRAYEQQIRKSLVTPPQIKAKDG